VRALLDTNVLLAGHRLPDGYDDLKVSAVTWAEIRRGIGIYRGSGDSLKAVRFENQYQHLRLAFGAGLPFDDAVAASFQNLVELTHAAGRDSRGRILDLMIAATAVVHGADLVTANPANPAGFVGLEELVTVVTP
jgi:predicted nucleic acid-binding protein